MTSDEFQSLAARMQLADERTCAVLVQDMPRSGKGRDAFLALCHQQAVTHALMTALQAERNDCQLLRLAYLGAVHGDPVH